MNDRRCGNAGLGIESLVTVESGGRLTETRVATTHDERFDPAPGSGKLPLDRAGTSVQAPVWSGTPSDMNSAFPVIRRFRWATGWPNEEEAIYVSLRATDRRRDAKPLVDPTSSVVALGRASHAPRGYANQEERTVTGYANGRMITRANEWAGMETIDSRQRADLPIHTNADADRRWGNETMEDRHCPKKHEAGALTPALPLAPRSQSVCAFGVHVRR